MNIRIAFYSDETNPVATVIDLAGWPAIADLIDGMGLDLRNPEEHDCVFPLNPATGKPSKTCNFKDGIAWSPVTLSEPYRLDQNVTSVNLAVFDLDHITLDALESTLDKLKAEKYTFVCHSTHGHKAPVDCAVRIILPLSRVVTPKEWERIFSAARKTLIRAADTHCKNASRFYFMPRIPKSTPYFFREYNGRPLDVDELLMVNATSTTANNAPTYDEPATVNLGDLRGAVTALRRSKKDSDPIAHILLGRVLDGRFLAVPGDSDFNDTDGIPKGRDGAVNKVAAMLAFKFDADTPVDAVVELLRPSIVKMACDPEGPDFWLQKARDSYSRALARRVDQDNQRKESNARLRAMLNNIVESRGTRQTNDKPKPEIIVPGETDEELYAALEKGPKTGRPLPSRINIESILERSIGTRSFIRWNEYAKKIDVIDGPFKGLKAGQVALEIASWFERDFQLSIQTQAVKESITLTAFRHTYNPLTEYLRSLQWDGTPRLTNLLIDYMNTRREGPDGLDLTPLLQAFGRKWAISAIARAFDPGCQVDTILVLEGPEGYKKTSFFRALGGPFFAATSVKMGDKDSKMAVSSAWIIELAEMAGLKKSDNAELKAFITTTEDFFRRPYEAALEMTPRTSVLVGTVNPGDFQLPSADENRRYWCVYVDAPVDTGLLEADRDQIWAEAVAAYAEGFGEDGKTNDYLWWLSPAEEAIARKIAHEKTAPSTLIGRLEKWWNRLPVDSRPSELTTDDVIDKLMLSNDDPTKLRSLATEIGTALRQFGFTAKRERRGKGAASRPVMVYRPTPEHLMHLDTTPAPGITATVHNIADRRKTVGT